MTKRTNTTKANYTFNHTDKKIFITRRFENAANIIGSDAYNKLVRLTKDFPTYSISIIEPKKKQGKVSYKGLTIDEMKRFVSTIGTDETALFNKVIEIAQNKTSPYAVIKKWFLNKYKEDYLNEIANAQNVILEAELDTLDNEINETEVDTEASDEAA